MHEITYYLPREIKTKQVAVVLVCDDKKISRGIAVCSKNDQFNRKRGRMIAMGRAQKAFATQETSDKNDIVFKFEDMGLPDEFDAMGSYQPDLTDFETDLLSKLPAE